jgi:hypothetical protein
MDNLPHPNRGLADHDPPISTGSLDDGDEEGASRLPNLAFGDGSLHQTQGFVDDVLRDGCCQTPVVTFALRVPKGR